jgi:hypothetical protein
MKAQGVHALHPLDCINTNHRRLAGEIDCCNNHIELGRIEIAFKLLARRPFFDEQQSFAFVEVRTKTSIQATRSYSRWAKHRTKRSQQRRSPFISSTDLHRENDHGSVFSVAVATRNGQKQLSLHIAKRGPTNEAKRAPKKCPSNQRHMNFPCS